MKLNTTIPPVTLILTIFLINTPLHSDGVITYISPGIRIGYNIGEGATIGVKLSYGFLTETAFYNITIGGQQPLGRRISRPQERYSFFEFQSGTYLDPPALLFGGGMGMAFTRVGDQKLVAPKMSVFGGFWAFATMDLVMFKDREINNLGAEFVLPIPFGLNQDLGLR